MSQPPYRQPRPGFGNEAPPPPPAFPAPPPPEGGYGCPKCGSPHLTESAVEDAADRMGMVFAALNQTTCNACGYSFNGKTGKSTTPMLMALIMVPLGLVAIVFGIIYLLSSSR